ncbi:MAG: aminodeoxychorismate/anthranilate synthase component II [Acidobacteriota bacterium]|nr:aminodeoxychorismate/anthranilate synthase component II [Blastocatellia bacterium]MDW8412421.1 aminodeoxychorismate/anthranilate synthase component II [Acidobacteriota bacterium]
MILVIDNYDSFTYNLVQYIGEFDQSVAVYRNDRISIEEIKRLSPKRIVISPGPGRPETAGISLEVVRQLGSYVPILGVCLGHQVIAVAFGAKVVHAPYLMHGKTSEICHDGLTIFKGLEYRFAATRYHSLIVDRDSIPPVLEVSATTPDGLVMGLRHREYPIEGVQFHPESIMTTCGKTLIKNFLSLR